MEKGTEAQRHEGTKARRHKGTEGRKLAPSLCRGVFAQIDWIAIPPPFRAVVSGANAHPLCHMSDPFPRPLVAALHFVP